MATPLEILIARLSEVRDYQLELDTKADSLEGRKEQLRLVVEAVNAYGENLAFEAQFYTQGDAKAFSLVPEDSDGLGDIRGILDDCVERCQH